MADTTTRYGFPYQEAADPPDGAALGEDLAEAVETSLGTVEDALDARLDLIEARMPRFTLKTGSTSRNTTTTLANDPDLAGIALEVGTYDIECLIFFTTAATTPKLKTQWGFTGTWNSSTRLCHGPGNTNVGTADVVTPSTFRGYTTDAQEAVYGAAASGAYAAVLETVRGLVVTVAGNLSLKWAQSVSSASATVIQPGSGFKVIKIA
jgi:hypothetical protein